jgi:hypothetical protein
MKITFKAFHAVASQDICKEFSDAHVQVLKDYGITNITSNNHEWMSLKCVYGIAAYNEAGLIIGGIRLQMSDGVNYLPVEKAIGKMDPKIHEIVHGFLNDGVGELNALWNAKEAAGIGLSLLLTRAGIAMSNQINCSIMLGICADYTLEMFRRVGFVVNNSLGNEGTFIYPNENYVARVLGILNSSNLLTAQEYDRERMLFIRNNPNSTAIELGSKGQELEVTYQLDLGQQNSKE